MAEEAKTYTVECPNCTEEFEVKKTPSELADGGDCLTCPTCDEEIEWEYDEATDTLEVVEFDDDDEEGESDLDDEEDDARG